MIIQILAAAMVAAAPVPTTPHAIVEALYAPYLANPHADGSKDMPGAEDMVRRYASKSLKAAIDFDRACEKREQGICNLDSDVLIDGQDWDISQLVIADQPVTPQGQIIRVTFINDHAPCSVTFVFIREGGVWKIDDLEDHSYDPDDKSDIQFWLKKELRGQS